VDTRSTFKFFSPAATSTQHLTVSEQFQSIIEQAQQSALPNNMPELDELEQTVRDTLQDVISPLERKLNYLHILAEESHNQPPPRQNINPFALQSLFAFKPPPVFSGAIGDSFSDWLEKINRFYALQNLTDSDADENFKIAFLENNLIGSASASYHEIKNRDNPPTTFTDITEALSLLYPEGKDADLHQQLLFDKRQKSTESILEYADILMNLGRLAYPTLNEQSKKDILKTIFLRGVSPKIRDQIKFREFISFDEAVKTSQYIESQLFREEIYQASNTISSISETKSNMVPKNCAICNRSNHNTADCHFNTYGQRRVSATFHTPCDFCGRFGHSSDQDMSPCSRYSTSEQSFNHCEKINRNSQRNHRQNFQTNQNRKFSINTNYIDICYGPNFNVIDIDDEVLYTHTNQSDKQNKFNHFVSCILDSILICGSVYCSQHAPIIVQAPLADCQPVALPYKALAVTATPKPQKQQTVTVETYHLATKSILEKPKPSGRIARWELTLSDTNINILPCKGHKNGKVELLSRVPLKYAQANFDIENDENYAQQETLNAISELSAMDLQNLQQTKLKEIIQEIKNSKNPHSIIRKNINNELKIVIPQSLHQSIIMAYHDYTLAGLFNANKTIKHISLKYLWPDLQRDVNRYVKSSKLCPINKQSRHKIKATLKPINPIRRNKNQTLVMRIRILYVDTQLPDCVELVPYAIFATNIPGNSPFEIIYGRTPALPIDQTLTYNLPSIYYDLATYDTEVKRHITQALRLIPKQTEIAQKEYNKQYDKHANNANYKIHDLIFKKLGPVNDGPYEIIKINYPNITIKKVDNTPKTKTIHVNCVSEETVLSGNEKRTENSKNQKHVTPPNRIYNLRHQRENTINCVNYSSLNKYIRNRVPVLIKNHCMSGSITETVLQNKMQCGAYSTVTQFYLPSADPFRRLPNRLFWPLQ